MFSMSGGPLLKEEDASQKAMFQSDRFGMAYQARVAALQVVTKVEE